MHRIFQAFPYSRLVAVCLAVLLALPLPLAAAPQQAPAPRPASLPDAPAPQAQPAATAAASSQSETALSRPPVLPGESSSQAQQAPGTQDLDQQDQAQHPVGTAAAPTNQPAGVAGARPAGAAIAPGKQRRVHALYIRIAIIVAAAGATGAVIGLSKASPSRPQ
ncbi:MAG TPA: hypothetical protein VG267_09265 [Terracidiphilus sp.]|jgi:hypothetical protein|nr:hypothetical protein [Terracidiphilus sp.]